MCHKCETIDRRIEKYKKLSNSILDRIALEGIATLISSLEAEKKSLHSSDESAS